jgi:diguanylate cyclase (GGDEF)-like protein
MTEQKYRILAVDDEPDVLEVLEQALEDEYEVFTAENGEDAIKILRNEAIDLLITDQRMPEMTGVKLLEESKAINPTMVRIILTGYTEPKDMVDAINRGEVYRYITKPWDLGDLLVTIRNGLEVYQLRKDKEGLVNDLEMRLNAMTVFLDLGKEAAKVRTYGEVIQSVMRYLPYIVDFDACASLVEQEEGNAILDIHCRRPLHESVLLDIPEITLAKYQEACGRTISQDDLLIQLSGEQPSSSDAAIEFASTVHVVLKVGGEPTGIMQLFMQPPEGFRQDTRDLLHIVANQTSEIILGLRQQILAERQRLELMVQSLADGIIMVDDQDQVFVINPAARNLLHLTANTPVNTRYLKDILGFYPFDLVRGWTPHNGTIVREEIQVFDKTLHSIVSPVRLGDKLLGVAVVLRDITEEKKLEERKEEFVSIVSHELRTPLTSIGGALDLLLHRFAGDINERQEHYLQLAKGSCDKLNMIIDDLLDLSRFEKGKMMLQMDNLSLLDLVSEATANYEAAAQGKGVKLEVEVSDQVIEVWGDRNRLHQVLNNLLSNALKFTSLGGQIKVSLIQSPALPGMVGVGVYNNGEEITETDHERIFDKFEQAKRNRGPSVSGSGLGLSISRGIIEAHGGCIWVESGKGEGTQFIFTLPISGEDQEDRRQADEVAGLTSALTQMKFKSPPLILVVDDDPKTTYIIKGLLSAKGYNVIVAHSGKKALELARTKIPDLIIMDIRMPKLDGLEVTDILHHDPETMEIPVVVLSAVRSEEEAYRSGASAYLAKPVELTRLADVVQEVMESRGLLKRMFKVLIVDDDPGVRSVCKEVLVKQGYATFEAESGRQALDILAKNKVDLILLDVMLPDFDGFQITEKVREDRVMADIPIIFVSARGQTTDKVRALKLGADDYVVKPFDALELGARVESVIKRKEREMDSSPTTKLPGSVAIEKELNRRLASKEYFALCYLDLDNLKAFNDYYGYAKANGVIHQTGDLISKAVEKYGAPSDFVGHIAGDDFVLICESHNAEKIAQEIISTFDRIIPLYYHPDDQARGYIEAEDRFGKVRRFKIMSISIAMVSVEEDKFRSHSEISEKAAELKKKAKSIEGSVLIKDTES